MNVKTILRWVLAAFLLFLSFGGGNAPAIILLIAAAVLVAPIQQLQEKLGPIGKKPLNIVVPVVLFLAALFISPNAKPADEPEPTATPVVTEAPTATPEPTAEPTPEPTEESAEAPTEAASTESVASLIEMAVKPNFQNYTIDTQDDMIILSVWNDNIAIGATMAQLGDEESKASWDELVQNQISMSNSCMELAKVAGRDDITLMINVLNDQDTSKTLLTTVNGVVMYNSVDN